MILNINLNTIRFMILTKIKKYLDLNQSSTMINHHHIKLQLLEILKKII